MWWSLRSRLKRLQDWQVFALCDVLCAMCSNKGTGLLCSDHSLQLMKEHDEFMDWARETMEKLDSVVTKG